jgi:hypothetical protein
LRLLGSQNPFPGCSITRICKALCDVLEAEMGLLEAEKLSEGLVRDIIGLIGEA